jgi:alanyl-tRNA synthetase
MFGLGEGSAGDCKDIIAKANEIFGGKGGGKKESAQGGAPYAADWKEKAEKLVEFLQK